MNLHFNLNRLGYFVATVEEGTITAAAKRLGLSKAVVSKQIQLLEQELGVSLLLRNTRHMQPTEAGMVFFDQSKALMIQANEAFDSVVARAREPSGRIRVTAPVDYGVSHVAPIVARFREMYPRVTIELVLSDEQLDVVKQRYDVAFRIGWLEDSSNLARKLRSFEEIAVCSPATAKKLSIAQPEDLTRLPFVANQALANETRWTFLRDGEQRKVDMQMAFSVNITLAIRTALNAGTLFTILPDFLLTDDLDDGRLVQLLPDWSLRSGGVYTVSPPSRLRASAVQVFLDLVHTEISTYHQLN